MARTRSQPPKRIATRRSRWSRLYAEGGVAFHLRPLLAQDAPAAERPLADADSVARARARRRLRAVSGDHDGEMPDGRRDGRRLARCFSRRARGSSPSSRPRSSCASSRPPRSAHFAQCARFARSRATTRSRRRFVRSHCARLWCLGVSAAVCGRAASAKTVAAAVSAALLTPRARRPRHTWTWTCVLPHGRHVHTLALAELERTAVDLMVAVRSQPRSRSRSAAVGQRGGAAGLRYDLLPSLATSLLLVAPDAALGVLCTVGRARAHDGGDGVRRCARRARRLRARPRGHLATRDRLGRRSSCSSTGASTSI